jgi:hypothetical protein
MGCDTQGMNQLEPFCAEIRGHERQAGDISAGVGQTRSPDRVTASGKHNRDFCRCLLGGKARRRTRGHDNIDLVLHELRRKTGKAVELAVRVDVFGFDRAALDVTELAHPPSVFFQKAVPLRLRSWYQPPDARKLSGMLLSKRLERS